jgi:hypothetical protein
MLLQVAMFVVLGLLVFPSDLPAVALPGLALAVLLVIVIRPIAVWISTAFSKFTARERVLLGWAGLRGAVPIVLATFVLSSELGKAETIFNAVFFVVVVSALLQGTTLDGGRRSATGGRRARFARARRVRRRRRPRDRGLRRARTRPPSQRRGRATWRHNPATGNHHYRVRRPSLCPCTADAPS